MLITKELEAPFCQYKSFRIRTYEAFLEVRIPKELQTRVLRSADSIGLSWGRLESGVRGNYDRKPKTGGAALIGAEYQA
jgi:hypothetical protein